MSIKIRFRLLVMIATVIASYVFASAIRALDFYETNVAFVSFFAVFLLGRLSYQADQLK